MRKALAILTLLCILTFSSAAQKGSVKGVVMDSLYEEGLSLASVAVYVAKDTSLITYRLSDEDGEFKIPGIPLNVLCRMVVTFQGYKVYRKEFSLTKEKPDLNLGEILLVEAEDEMDEVVIIAERPPVSMRNDTLEFNASAFKTLPGALVEDLLKKLPGVEVDLDGNITVNGKRINRLLVDGKEFFGGDPLIATRNLPANIVEKIQVTDDKEELRRNPLMTKDEAGQVLNVKLKKAVNQGWFGKAYAGGGTDSRHEAGAIVNVFREKNQVSVLGYSNNVNKPGFTSTDLQQVKSTNRGGTGSDEFFDGGGGGIQRSWDGGANLNTQLGKRLKLNAEYFYGGVNSFSETIATHQQFLKDTVLTTPSSHNYQQDTRNHRMSSSINWEIDSVSSFSFRASVGLGDNTSTNFGLSSTADNLKGLINRNESRSYGGGTNYTYKYSLNFSRWSAKKPGRSINIASDFSRNDKSGDNYSQMLYTFYSAGVGNDSSLNQLRATDGNDVQSQISIAYTEPVMKNVSLSVTHNASYSKEKNEQQIYDWDVLTGKYAIYNYPFSNGAGRQGWRNITAGNLSYQLKKWSVSPGANLFWSNFKNSFLKTAGIRQCYFFVLPSLNVSWKSWHLTYNVNVLEPGAADLQPVIDISDPLYKQYGNPTLRPAYTRSASLSYHGYNRKSGSSYNFSLNGSFTEDAVIHITTLDSNRVQTSQPVNVNGNNNFYAYGSYNKQYKFDKNFQLSLRPGINAGYSRSIVSINDKQSQASYLRASFNLNLLLNYRDKIEWNQRYTFTTNNSRYDDKTAFRDANLVTHNTQSEISVRWPQHVVWENAVAYNFNPQVAPGIRRSSVRWNAAVHYAFAKEDKCQLKLSVYDLLNQSVNVYRYTAESAVTDAQMTTLRRYFLVSFIYNIRTFGSGKKSKREQRYEMWE